MHFLNIQKLVIEEVQKAVQKNIDAGIFPTAEIPEVMLEIPPQKEYGDFEIRKHIFDIQPGVNDVGLFVNSSHGGNISNFIKELYKYDKSSAFFSSSTRTI